MLARDTDDARVHYVQESRKMQLGVLRGLRMYVVLLYYIVFGVYNFQPDYLLLFASLAAYPGGRHKTRASHNIIAY